MGFALNLLQFFRRRLIPVLCLSAALTEVLVAGGQQSE